MLIFDLDLSWRSRFAARSTRAAEARLLGRIQAWTGAHERPLLIAAFVVVGLYFTIRGIYTLTD